MRLIIYSVVSLMGLSALAQAGTSDPAFAPMDLSGGGANGLNGTCWSIALQPDGKILLGGDFTMVNGVDRQRIARLNADGSLDLEFDPGYGANSAVRTIAVQPDGKVLIGGTFSYYSGEACEHIARLLPDGSMDADFNMGNGVDGNVNALLVRQDGTVLVGGDFFHLNGSPSRGLACLLENGSADPTFDAGDMGIVYSLEPMSGDRILVGGLFSFVGGVERRCLASLESDGSLDMSFAPFGWGSSPVLSVAEQPDGKILAGGIIPGSIARMESNGEIDPFFGSGASSFAGWDPWVYDIALQSDGKILCAGRFESYNGTACRGMARLNADGTFDDSFLMGTGFNADVFTMAMQPDGKALVGGFFSDFNGTPQNRIARLFAEEFSTAVRGSAAPLLEVYPNPSNGMVFVNMPERFSSSLSVTGPDGRLVRSAGSTATATAPLRLDLSDFAKGIYLVRISDGSTSRTGRVLIQ